MSKELLQTLIMSCTKNTKASSPPNGATGVQMLQGWSVHTDSWTDNW